VDSSPQSRPLRLNPFAFPSVTSFRFILLIAAVLGASAFFYDSIFFIFNAQSVGEALRHCRETAQAIYPAELELQNMAFDVCRAPISLNQARWTITGMALLLVVSAAVFIVLPSWKIWRLRFVPLRSEDAPELTAYLGQLCREMELTHPPLFLCAPLNPTISGQVFGRPGRSYMVLNGGLVTQFSKNQGLFRSIVLHELAHLRNADVNKVYFSVAIWKAFLAAALFPYILSLLFSPTGVVPTNPAHLIQVFLRSAALAAVVFLTYKALLRARELYADVRASVYDGPSGNLDRMLAALRQPQIPRWRWLLLAHPDPVERRRSLTDTSGLFHLSAWEAFGTGVIAMISFQNVYFLLSYLNAGKATVLGGLTTGEFAAYGAMLIFMPMVAGILVAGIWRESFAARVGNTAPRGVNRLGIGLAAGIALGDVLSISQVIDAGATSGAGVLGFNAVWSIILLSFLLFLVHWVAVTASTWLRVVVSKPPAGRLQFTILITGALLLLLAGPMYLSYFLSLSFAQLGYLAEALLFGLLSFFTVSATYLSTIFAFIGLWAYPLAGVNRQNPAALSSWVFLGPPPSDLNLPKQAAFHLRPALVAGTATGLLWSGCLAALYLAAPERFPEFTQANIQQVRDFINLLFTTTTLIQAATGIYAAGRAKSLPLVQGLLAAFVSGCLMSVSLMIMNSMLVDGLINASGMWNIFSNVLGRGTLLVLPAVGLLTALVEWRGRLWRRKRQPAQDVPV
jgi:Zn-dependent protease with chaperone function